MTHAPDPARHRLDKWLWCVRFYRSRALATEAVLGGRVKLNGERVKPAHEVREGDLVGLTRGTQMLEVTVLGLPQRRGPASQAQQAWQETPRSREGNARLREASSLAALSRPRAGRPPDKRERRAMERLLRRGE